MATNGLGLPPTRQSLVVVNGALCRKTYSDRHNEKEDAKQECHPFGNVQDHGIAPHELCFSIAVGAAKSLRFNEPAISVFSSFNGAKHTDDPANYRFIGVSQTTIPEPFAGNGHLSMCAAGVVRIFNTGPENIDIGDKVYWDLPVKGNSVSIEGMPKSKIYAYTKSVKHQAVTHVSDRIVEIMGATATTGKEKETAMRKLLKGVDGPNSRVIGVALSRAQTGQSFDILLRYC